MFEILDAAQKFFESGTAATLALATVIAGMVKVLSSLGKAVEIHDKLLLKRKYTRLVDMRSSIPDANDLHRELGRLIYAEIFYISFGVKAAPLKSAFLLKLYQTGLWRPSQIKHFAKYVSIIPDSNDLAIDLGLPDKVAALFGFIMGIFVILFGGGFWVYLIFQATIAGYLAGLGVFLFAALIGGLLASEYSRYKSALGIKDFFDKHRKDFGVKNLAKSCILDTRGN